MSHIAKGTALAAAGVAALLLLPMTGLLFVLAAGYAARRRTPWNL